MIEQGKFGTKLPIILHSGALKQVKLNSLKLHFLQVNLFLFNFFINRFCSRDDHWKDAGRRPKTWSKMTNFIALWDFQNRLN